MNVAVYCSASNFIDEKYHKTAFQLGEWLAENEHTLIYGGAAGGLMDSVSDGALAKGGEVIGVIARAIIKLKRRTDKPIQLLVAQSMSERKAMMRALADVFVVLPGGFGTFDEAFDVVAAATVGEHKKPIIFVNQNNFYEGLLLQTERCRTENFIPSEEIYKSLIANDINECFEMLSLAQNFLV